MKKKTKNPRKIPEAFWEEVKLGEKKVKMKSTCNLFNVALKFLWRESREMIRKEKKGKKAARWQLAADMFF